MRYTLLSIMLFFNQFCGFSQDADRLWATSGKMPSYYIGFEGGHVLAYRMGSFMDKAGLGHSILSIDTMTKQIDSTYFGKHASIVKKDGKSVLITNISKRKKKLSIEPVMNQNVANTQLNNAYFWGKYFAMSTAVRDSFPMSNYSFRAGFEEWDHLDNKEQNYVLFRGFAGERISYLKDSIVFIQIKLTATVSFITENIQTLPYDVLKDSLDKLPRNGYSSYYWTSMYEMVKQRPEYLFRLAEDYPQDQGRIFFLVDEKDKDMLATLRAIDGYDKTKKAFFKDVRERKYLLFHAVGMYTLVIAGVVLLLI